MSYDSWLEGPYQRMVEQGEEMLAREEAEMPARKPRGAKAVACSVCGAGVGEPCRGSMRGRPVESHRARVALARERAVG